MKDDFFTMSSIQHFTLFCTYKYLTYCLYKLIRNMLTPQAVIYITVTQPRAVTRHCGPLHIALHLVPSHLT